MNAIEMVNGVRTVALECGRKRLRVALVEITPTLALYWLDGADNYRNANDNRLDKYKLAIKDGLWELNGDTIKIGKNGKCIDGQHRLKACIQTNKSFVSLVVFDVNSVNETDRGMNRTINQELIHRGYSYASVISGALINIWLYQNHPTRKSWFIRGGYRSVTSNIHLIRVLEDNSEVLEKLAHESGKGLRLLSGTISTTVLFLGLKASGVSIEKATEFMEGLMNPELRLTDPRRALREKLLANKLSKHKMGSTDIMALVVKTWNAFLEGRSISRQGLKWDASREEFPDFVTKKELS